MTLFKNQHGFSPLIVILVLVVLTGLGGTGYYVWSKNKDDTSKKNDTSQNSKDKDEDKQGAEDDITKGWASATTVGGRLEMKIPDGWKLTRYPGDYIGSIDISYAPGTAALIETSTTEYMGHSLSFRASISQLDDAGLGPQWESPQPGLSETTQAVSIGELDGKRYKGTFSGDVNKTLYEYVFDLGSNEKLDILYTVDHTQNEQDIISIVEKAIKTISIN